MYVAKIVSGGQTVVDRGALGAALKAQLASLKRQKSTWGG